MKKKDDFTVTNPRIISVLVPIVLAICVLILVFNTIFGKPPHLAMYIMFILFIMLPFSIALLWSKLFKVTVSGSKITVRRGTGLKYSFDVSEIKKVDWKIVNTKTLHNEKITVRTASRHFSIATLMDGFDNMSEYILTNVDSNKINTSKKNTN